MTELTGMQEHTNGLLTNVDAGARLGDWTYEDGGVIE